MRRMLALVAAWLLTAGISSGQTLWAHTQEVRIGGSLLFDSSEGRYLQLETAYGYFLWDYVEVLLRAGWVNSDLRRSRRIGLGGEVNYDLGGEIIPFLGANLFLMESHHKWPTADNELVGRQQTALVLGMEGGVKFFLSERVALAMSLTGEIGTKKVYATKRGVEKMQLRADTGLRFFF